MAGLSLRGRFVPKRRIAGSRNTAPPNAAFSNAASRMRPIAANHGQSRANHAPIMHDAGRTVSGFPARVRGRGIDCPPEPFLRCRRPAGPSGTGRPPGFNAAAGKHREDGVSPCQRPQSGLPVPRKGSPGLPRHWPAGRKSGFPTPTSSRSAVWCLLGWQHC